MGDAPMASSAGAVVALSVDLSVGVGGVPCSEPVDDCAEKCFGPELSSTVIPPDDISSDASDADILPDGVTTPTVPVPTPTPSVIRICDTPGCRRRPESDPCGLQQVSQHICCDM